MIVTQVVFQEGATAAIIYPHGLIALPIYAITPHSWITAADNSYTSVGIAEDIVVLDGPLAVLVNKDSRLLSVALDVPGLVQGAVPVAYAPEGLGLAAGVEDQATHLTTLLC